MAQAPTPPPVTEDAFLADRISFWKSFNAFTLGAVIVVATLLLLLAFFLVWL